MPSIYHLLSRQIPAHVQQNYPIFCKFIEYYYRWLQTRSFVDVSDINNIDSTITIISIEDSTITDINKYLHHTISNGEAIGEIVGIEDGKLVIRYIRVDSKFVVGDTIHIRPNSDDAYTEQDQLDTATISRIETAPSVFIEHFSNMLDADKIFGIQSENIALILRNIRQLYQSKGNEQALKYLIKATKGVDVEIRYPWENVLKLSDGKWNRQYCITVMSDQQYWHYVPLQMQYLRLMYNDTDANGNQLYRDFPITKIEIFGKQHENYDQDWWTSHADDITVTNPFTYDNDRLGFDNGYWSSVIDVEKLIEFCFDTSDRGFDNTKWEIVDPIESLPPGVDGSIFDDEINQYDENGPYWIRDEHPELGPYQIDPVSGAIVFEGEKSNCTYGRWGYRHVTPFIRFYFDEDVGAELGQEVRTIETNEDGEQYVSYVGTVVEGIDHVSVINGGSGWQVGQIFTASKDQIWTIYSEPYRDGTERSLTLINEQGISIEYSIDKPLIGRVLTVDSNGAIQTVEVLQYGDHVPIYGARQIQVSPLFYHDDQIDETPYIATLQVEYSVNSHSTGYFSDASGFLSYSDIHLQDSDYWQQFSYDIIANVDGSQYTDIANLLHPAGTKMFTTYQAESNLDAAAQFEISMDGVAYNLSLFDIAYATDKLFKQTFKYLSDDVNVSERVIVEAIKRLADDVVVSDTCYNENVIMYSLNVSYDVDDQQLMWVERTVDNVAHVKTSYTDSGMVHYMYINYDYHYVVDFPENNPPQYQIGAYVPIYAGDGIEIISSYPVDEFQSAGTRLTVVYRVIDNNRYKYTGVTIFDQSTQTFIEPFVSYDPDADQYTASFDAPSNSCILFINTDISRYSINCYTSEYATLTTSQNLGFAGDRITVSADYNTNRYVVNRYYYYSEQYGTIYFDGDTFSLPASNVFVGAEYVGNGGIIHVVSNGGSVNFNVDVNSFVEKGTIVSFTAIANDFTSLQNSYLIDSDGTVTPITDNSFIMLDHDVTLQLNFQQQKRQIIITINHEGTSSNGIVNVQPLNSDSTAYAGNELRVRARPDSHSTVTEFYYQNVGGDGTTIALDIIDSIIVGAYPIAIYATFKQNGGYINVEPIQYQYIESSNVDVDSWIENNQTVTITFKQLSGRVLSSVVVYDSTGDTIDSVLNGNTVTFIMPQDDITLEIGYQYITYRISTRADGPGTVTVNPTSGTILQRCTYTATPTNDHCRLLSVQLITPDYTTELSSTTFDIPPYDCTVVGHFEQHLYDVQINQQQHGTVSIKNTNIIDNSSGNVYTVHSQSTVQLNVAPEMYYQVQRVTVTKGTQVIDITDSLSFVADDTCVVNVQYVRTVYTCTINRLQSVTAPTSGDGSLNAFNASYLVVDIDGTVTNGPTNSQSPVTCTFTGGQLINVSLHTVEVSNPSDNTVNTTLTTGQSTYTESSSSRSVGVPMISNRGSFISPSDNITINCTVNKRFVRV